MTTGDSRKERDTSRFYDLTDCSKFMHHLTPQTSQQPYISHAPRLDMASATHMASSQSQVVKYKSGVPMGLST